MHKIAKMKNNPLLDSALFIAFTTASLFVIGYLYEAPFLEKFGLNNEEFIPSSTKLIICGFKYMYLKLGANMMIVGFGFMILVISTLALQDLIFEWIKKNTKYDELIKFKSFILYAMISTVPFFTVVSSVKIIKDGGDRYQNYLNLNDNQLDTLYTSKYPEGIKGKTIRYQDNKIAFFDITHETAKVFPDSQIIELKYSNKKNE